MSVLGLTFATVSWGLSFLLIKDTVAVLGVWPTLFVRYTLAFLFIGAVFPKKVLRPPKGVVASSFKIGFLLFLATWTQTQGLSETSVGHSGFITSLYVPLTPLMGWLFFKQNIFFKDLFTVALATFGLYLLTVSDGPFFFNRKSSAGDLWTLGTAFTYGLHILVTEKITRSEPDSIALGVWQFLWCGVFIDSIFLFLFLTGKIPQKIPGHFWEFMRFWQWPTFILFSILFNAVITTDFAFIMQIICQKTLSSVKAALIFALEAPFASLFAFLFKGDILTRRELCGAAIVFLASMWPERWLKKKQVEVL